MFEVCGGVVLILVKAVKMHLFQKKLLIFCSGLSVKLAEGCVSVCVLMFSNNYSGSLLYAPNAALFLDRSGES